MPLFLDVNVWLPLVWDGHAASESTHRWAARQSNDFILCRVTQLALLRHLTNPVVLGDDALANAEAAQLLDALLAQNAVAYREEPAILETFFPRLGESPAPAHHRWTDAYLAAFAMASRCELVSYDRGFAAFEPEGLQWTLLET